MHETKRMLLTIYGSYCMLCGRYVHKGIQWHHIIPRSAGGNNSFKNGALLCPHCHRKIHTYLYGSKEYEKLTKEVLKWKRK